MSIEINRKNPQGGLKGNLNPNQGRYSINQSVADPSGGNRISGMRPHDDYGGGATRSAKSKQKAKTRAIDYLAEMRM